MSGQALNMLDADGDSTMHSSPELAPAIDDDDDSMFPDEAQGPSTPRKPLIGRDSELSPPDSQGPPNLARDDSTSHIISTTSSNLNENGKRVYASAIPTVGGGSQAAHTDPETGYQWSRQEDQPGWEWKSPRAREEEMRALESIVDKHAMIKNRYGDPLDASIPAKRR